MSTDRSQYYSIGTPIPKPLRFCPDGVYRLLSWATCRECSRDFGLTLRCDRFRTESGIMLDTPAPDPKDEAIIADFILNACNRGCGCANRENFFAPVMGWEVWEDRLKLSEGGNHRYDAAVDIGAPECRILVKNPEHPDDKMPYEKLVYMPKLHTRACSVGQMVRRAPFYLEAMGPKVKV